MTAGDSRQAPRALSFGARAEAYERFRPGYPGELFDTVMSYAGQPVLTALEIGAGTGKATRLFARRGVTVTATEPDGAMLAELRKHVPANVKTVQAAFEDVRPAERYGLVYAAAALHWTNPEGRWQRMAALVRPGGVFASFGGPAQLADPAVEKAVRAARAPFLNSDEAPSPDETSAEDGMRWPGTELQRSEWFDDVRQFVIERRLTMSAADYVGHLSTISAYLELPAAEQEQVYRQIGRVLPDTVAIAADTIVHLARRRLPSGPAGAWHVNLRGEDLAAAGHHQLRGAHAPPFGGHDEQRRVARPADGAGEAASVQFHGPKYRAALGDAHALLARNVGVPHRVLRVGADAVRGALAEVCPDAPAGQAAIRADVEAHQQVPVGIRHDQGGVVGGDRHPVGKRDVIGHLPHGPVRRYMADRTRLERLAGHRVEPGPVDVDVAAPVGHDVIPAWLAELGVDDQRSVGLHCQQLPLWRRDKYQLVVWQPGGA